MTSAESFGIGPWPVSVLGSGDGERRQGFAGDAGDTRREAILAIADSVIASAGLKASLSQIAAVAGIQTASMYHHFDSKECLLVELLARFHQDIDDVGRRGLERVSAGSPRRTREELIVELCEEIAGCAVRNGAALQMSLYEIPFPHQQLSALMKRPPTTVLDAMTASLRADERESFLRGNVEVSLLAARLCQSMMLIGLDSIRHRWGPGETARTMSGVVLHGLAVACPPDKVLDASPALVAANRAMETWVGGDAFEVEDERLAHIHRTARVEFGRKGYEVTTLRDVAEAAGVRTTTLNRLIGSKESLLNAVMHGFDQKVTAGWSAVLQSESTAVEKIDALNWININILDRFSDEFRIQLAWMRQSPPSVPTPGQSFATRIREIKTVVKEGQSAGDFRVPSRPRDALARCVVGLMWTPDVILNAVGKRSAHLAARDHVLRGVARPARGAR